MFEVGWSELLVIAVVMIVVVGPKDLPNMLRTFGRTAAKLRAMAGDFQKQFNEALKEAELDDVKSSIDSLRSLNPMNEVRKQLNPFEQAAADVRAGVDTMMKPKPAADPTAPAAETPQAADGITYAKKITAAEARIDWSRSALELDRMIRGLSPFPGAWFTAPSAKGETRIKALLSRAEGGAGPPGAVLPGTVLDDAGLVACGEGAVRLLGAQREGKGPQEAADFLRGFPLLPGTRLA